MFLEYRFLGRTSRTFLLLSYCSLRSLSQPTLPIAFFNSPIHHKDHHPTTVAKFYEVSTSAEEVFPTVRVVEGEIAAERLSPSPRRAPEISPFACRVSVAWASFVRLIWGC